MGFFNRGSKNKKASVIDVEDQEMDDVVEPKKRWGKKEKGKAVDKPSRFRKRKTMTLIERMQLPDSVAQGAIGVVEDIIKNDISAIREVTKGYLIIVITNEMLEDSGVDPSSEDFGSFSEALRSESILAITLTNDLVAGVIGLIPSKETLVALDEYDFLRDMEFKWAILPYDLTDDDRLIVLDTTVDIEHLLTISSNPSIILHVEDNDVIETDEDDTVNESRFDRSPNVPLTNVPTPVFPEHTDEDDLDVNDSADVPEGFPDDVFNEDHVPYLDEEDDEDDDNYNFSPDGMSDSVIDFSEAQASDDYETNNVTVTAEEANAMIHRATTIAVENDELALTVDTSIFDQYFDTVVIAAFNTTKTDDGILENGLAQMRNDANVELQRFHQENIQNLRNKFITNMLSVHNILIDELDYKNPKLTYGEMYQSIESLYDDALSNVDRLLSEQVKDINAVFEEDRLTYAENAKREALSIYDSKHKQAKDQKVEQVKQQITLNIKTDRDIKQGEMFRDRRIVAKRFLDKATVELLQRLQQEFQDISKQELEMYDTFRKSMDTYVRKYFADEVLRAKVEAEKMKQSHQAESVRQEYNQFLASKEKQIEIADRKSKAAISELTESHQQQLHKLSQDYDVRISKEQADNEALRSLLLQSNETMVNQLEKKEQEIQHRFNMFETQLETKDRDLEYANNRFKNAQKPMIITLVATFLIALAIGVLFGFLSGAKAVPTQTQTVPTQTQTIPTTPTNTTSMITPSHITSFYSSL